MLRLSEFLLARIAEDEDAANGVNRGLFNSRVAMLPGDLYGLVIRQHPARVMAECEAKRRIVEDCIRLDKSGADDDWTMGYADGNFYALRLLALPYADHEDFQEEWRP